ncbi:MAG: hypothetical protein QOI81_1247 [Actinomycetota bacterium]|nr:hypothetical protein [Actinomycetota bacterium]
MASTLSGIVLPTSARAGTGTCLFGAHALPRGGEASQKDSTLALEAELGRTLGVFRRYSYWDEPPPDLTHLWAAQGGRTPYISWHAYTRNGTAIPWASIARGDQDAFIRTVATGLAAFPYPIFFNFHHEPENDAKNGTSADFKAAFARVRSLFDQQGATNLTWVCTLMGTTYRGRNGGADAWLPDGQYFSLVGSDGYNRWPVITKPAWRSFSDLFTAAHDKAVQLGKPLFVGEYGCVEQVTQAYPNGDPNAKANWFLGAGQTVQTWGNVTALSYSHASAMFGGKLMPYWVDSTSIALNGFKTVGQSPYFA